MLNMNRACGKILRPVSRHGHFAEMFFECLLAATATFPFLTFGQGDTGRQLPSLVRIGAASAEQRGDERRRCAGKQISTTQ